MKKFEVEELTIKDIFMFGLSSVMVLFSSVIISLIVNDTDIPNLAKIFLTLVIYEYIRRLFPYIEKVSVNTFKYFLNKIF